MTTRPQHVVEQGPEVWDAVVIGAGLAGSVAGYLLAKRGLSTLLVEAKPFPRPKVCGGCLNDRAITCLDDIGLGDVLTQIGARPFDSVEIVLRGKRVRLPVPSGVALTREPLDAAIVDQAESAGVTFLPSTSARVAPLAGEPFRRVRLGSGAHAAREVRAGVVLACDGLGHPSLGEIERFVPEKAVQSRVGLGAVVDASELRCYAAGRTLQMAVGRRGYVGFSFCEENRVSIAAAVDRDAMTADRSPSDVIAGILQEAGLASDPAIGCADWRGTRPLSQRTRWVSEERLLLLGDAAGYVEPFTGEGMAAAIESACLAAPLATEAARVWRQRMAEDWQNTYTSAVRNHQKACSRLAWLLRRPRLAGLALRVVAGWPQLGVRTARGVSSRRKLTETTACAQQSPG